MYHHSHNDRRYAGQPEALRSAERIARLELERVVALTLEGTEMTSLLDVGTGTGVFAQAFCSVVSRVVGIDINIELLTIASHHVSGVCFIKGAAEALPFDDRSFDGVFLGHVLHEVDDPLATLREAHRVARNRVAILEWPCRAEAYGPPLEHRLRPETVDKLARDAGFHIVEHIEMTHMILYRLVT